MSQLLHWNSRVIDAETLYFYATLARLVYQHDLGLWNDIVREYDEFTDVIDTPTLGQLYGGWTILKGLGGSIVVIAGSHTWQQWVVNIVPFFNGSFNEFPGMVHSGWGLIATVLYQLLRDALIAAPAPLTIVGHSLGGVLAQLVAHQYIGEFKSDIEGVITFGCPRVGDPDYAEATRFRLIRLENQFDPIPVLPPRVIYLKTPQGPIPNPGPTFPILACRYEHAGDQYIVGQDSSLSIHRGGRELGEYPPVATNLGLPLNTNDIAVISHSSNAYVARLKSREMQRAGDFIVRGDRSRALDRINNVVNEITGTPWRINERTGRQDFGAEINFVGAKPGPKILKPAVHCGCS